MLSSGRSFGKTLALMAAAWLAACGPLGRAAPAESSTSYAGGIQRSCAPWDGAALELELERVSGRGPDLLRIQLWRGSLPAPTESIALPDDSSGGGWVMACTSDGNCATAEKAILSISSQTGSTTISGRLLAGWAGRPDLNARFRAHWAEQEPVLCG